MRAQDLVHILARAHGVRDAFGIDDHARPQLATVEAAAGVDAHIGETKLLGPRLHVVTQPLRALVLAAPARMSLRALIDAAEDMGAIERRRLLDGRTHERLSPRMASVMPDQNAFWI